MGLKDDPESTGERGSGARRALDPACRSGASETAGSMLVEKLTFEISCFLEGLAGVEQSGQVVSGH